MEAENAQKMVVRSRLTMEVNAKPTEVEENA